MIMQAPPRRGLVFTLICSFDRINNGYGPGGPFFFYIFLFFIALSYCKMVKNAV